MTEKEKPLGVAIIGAGMAGLLIAQGLQKVRFPVAYREA
jgi:2-polyprenyl-6-methoxyphenol hydroxylase-like FAD-dependent oxidoreductase